MLATNHSAHGVYVGYLRLLLVLAVVLSLLWASAPSIQAAPLSGTHPDWTFEANAGSSHSPNATIQEATQNAAGTVYYVDADATGNAANATGKSWSTAFKNLQDALKIATDGDQIWVAEGVYYPDVGGGNTDNKRNASFSIPSGVVLYGGFDPDAAVDELAERDWKQYPTVLSGDIEQDDKSDENGVVANYSDIQGKNSNHVLHLDGTTDPITATTVIDGFTITAGSAEGSEGQPDGGGLYCLGSGEGATCSPTISNVTFSGNLAKRRGGAMFNDGVNGASSPTLNNVAFLGNKAEWGGAMFNDGVNGTSSPTLTSVDFKGNLATNSGGAVYNDGSNPGKSNGVSSPSFTNVLFNGNLAAFGGAMYNDAQPAGTSSPTLVNVTLGGNRATASGGAMYSVGSDEGASSPSLTNVILWQNSARNGNSIFNDNAQVFLSYGIVENGRDSIENKGDSSVTWNSLTNVESDPLFVQPPDPTKAPTASGDLRVQFDSPAIDAGNNLALNYNVATDLDGNDRIINGTIDMGAYESSKPATEWRVQSALEGHKSAVKDVEWSPDGSLVVAASTSGPIVWDTSTGKRLPLEVQGDNFSSVDWSPDGERLAAGFRGGVQMWSRGFAETEGEWEGPTTAIPAKSLQTTRSIAWSPDGSSLAVGENTFAIPWKRDGNNWKPGSSLNAAQGALLTTDVSWSPDGRRLFVGAWTEDATVWEWIEDDDGYWNQLDTLEGSKSQTHQFSWSPDGSRLAFINWSQLKVQDQQTGKTAIRFDTSTRPLQDVAWSPDGSRIAVADTENSNVRILDTESWQVLDTLRVFDDQSMVNTVAWSPDGKRLVTGSEDGSVRIWHREPVEPVTWKEWDAQSRPSSSGTVSAVMWSPDGSLLAYTYNGTSVNVWDIKNGKSLGTLDGHIQWARDIAWSPDGSRIATADNESVRVWDVETLTNEATLKGHGNFVWSIAWSPDGKKIASGSWDNTIKVWDIQTQENLETISTGRVLDVAWSPDGKQLAWGLSQSAGDGTLQVRDVEKRQNFAGLQGNTDSVWSVSWSPDGNRLFYGFDDGTIQVLDAKTRENLGTLKGHTDNVYSLSWSPDDSQLVSGSEDGTIRVWDMEKMQEGTPLLSASEDKVYGVAWSPDGSLIASGTQGGLVRVWKQEHAVPEATDETWERIAILTGHRRPITGIAWSPEDALVSGAEDGMVMHWNIESKEGVPVVRDRSAAVTGVAWSHDGSQLAAAMGDGRIQAWIWEVLESGHAEETLAEFHEHTQAANGVAWAPDGSHLASSSWDQTVRVWQVDQDESLAALDVYSNTQLFTGVAWSPDGRLAAGTTDGSVQVWQLLKSIEAGDEPSILQAHDSQVTGIAWSPDGHQLATGSLDKTVRVWEWDETTEKWQQVTALRGTNHDVMSLAWSPDGRRIATGSSGGDVRVWDVEKGQLLASLEGHTGPVASVAWSPDGRRIASGSWDKTLQVWECKDKC